MTTEFRRCQSSTSIATGVVHSTVKCFRSYKSSLRNCRDVRIGLFATDFLKVINREKSSLFGNVVYGLVVRITEALVPWMENSVTDLIFVEVPRILQLRFKLVNIRLLVSCHERLKVNS